MPSLKRFLMVCENVSICVALVVQLVDEPVRLLMHGRYEVVGPTFIKDAATF